MAGRAAVVAFTGRAYVLADVDPAELRRAEPTATAGRRTPEVLVWLAGRAARSGRSTSCSWPRRRPGAGRSSAAPISATTPASAGRAHHRRDVEVYGDDAGLVVLGRGLVGRRELSVELLDPSTSGRGHGRRLIAAGLGRVPAGEWCWAQVSPGNAASLRAFLACGFVPVCSEVLIEPRPPPGTLRSTR